MTKIKHKDNIAFFLSFCIEIYKNKHFLSGDQALRLLSNSGTLRFLESNFEPIHTQSPQWILEEIEDYLSCNYNSNP